ncbi:MAG: hypothetical protein CL670_16400 [Balneola sp.]|mgnify:CR=1 FL=1|jgi:hypothetical protein|nr:hypothetical protein [Balneola sp.]MBE80742.1 hypothetical protein [Balneola sp.]|tara:strand:+ start:443 stop:1177 length:735 start_codon:yes stop_codon:yes gene_type:complete
MKGTAILSILILLFISCSSNSTGDSTEVEDVPEELTPKQQLVEKGKTMANELKAMMEDQDVQTGEIPIVFVSSNSNALIYYNQISNAVYVPWYDDLSSEMLVVMQDFADASDMDVEEFFETFFNTFFYYHEFAHWAQSEMDGQLSPNRYMSEIEANEITIAYLESSQEGRDFLASIEPKLNALTNFLENPTPEGVSEEEYFNENYNELGSNAYHYGYFQFKFVKNVLDQSERPTLDEIIDRRSE